MGIVSFFQFFLSSPAAPMIDCSSLYKEKQRRREAIATFVVVLNQVLSPITADNFFVFDFANGWSVTSWRRISNFAVVLHKQKLSVRPETWAIGKKKRNSERNSKSLACSSWD